MARRCAPFVFLLAATGCATSATSSPPTTPDTAPAPPSGESEDGVLGVTPILVVEAIEPCLGFWAELGFEREVEVPEGDRLGFVILRRGGLTVMYQTVESVTNDIPAVLALGEQRSLLYLRVTDVEAVAARIEPTDVVIPLRITPYGAREVFVREPGGHVVGFAQFPNDG